MRDLHIIPGDNFQHIEDPSCDCNPQLSYSEGELRYIHNTTDKPKLNFDYKIEE